ncbi:odorant receptor Or2-like [Photinus pyralis]|uniref:odorant receptor Or2-like n=1 Tax=Photinus pyralis TaxID=7054 RepID=UPI001267250D|nr:odorant receptor Or2-like [Photinus pyralis]
MSYSFTGCLVLQVAVVTFLCFEYALTDTIKLSIMIQLKLHFKYLKLSVQELIANAKDEFCMENELESWSVCQYDIPFVYLQKQSKRVIDHYNYIIQVASETELIFNKCVLFSFISMSFVICLAMLRISNMQQVNTEHLEFLFYIIAPLIVFFVDCYFTQEVITENEAFAYSFYEIDFIGTHLAFQKCLILCIARAQRLVSFTIGKFVPLTMVATITIVKASFSYYTLLKSRNKD